MGNPLNYNNGSSYTFTWKNGRELATLSTGTTSVTYNYNADSVRIKKTVNGIVHEYVVDGYKILEEKYGTTVLKFTYDENDSPQSISANGTVYYYGKNLQGDIVKICDSNGNAVAGYSYDAWGNILSITYTSIYGASVSILNPFRYRGYYYDTESGLYYLNSRYYDAKVGRFINADDPEFLGATGTNLSYNLYAYCENNYININDYSGQASILALGFQIAISLGHVIFGVEGLWSLKNGKFYLFFFIGGVSRNPLHAIESAYKQDLAMLKSHVPKFSLKPGSFSTKISASVSFIMVFGNKHASFPSNYCGWFTGISFSFRHVSISGSYGKSGKAKIWSFALGASTSTLSLQASQTYYVQVTGDGVPNNNKSALFDAINDRFAFFKLFLMFL